MAWYDAQVPAWIRPAVVTPTEGGNAFAQGLELGLREQELRLQEKREELAEQTRQVGMNHTLAQTELLRQQLEERKALPQTVVDWSTDWRAASGDTGKMLDTYGKWMGPLSRTDVGRTLLLNADKQIDDQQKRETDFENRKRAWEMAKPVALREAEAITGFEGDAALKLRQANVAREEGDEMTASRLEGEASALRRQIDLVTSRRTEPVHTRIIEAETITRKRREAKEARAKGNDELATELEREASYIETTAPHQGLEQAVDVRNIGALRLTAQKSIQKLEAEFAAAQVWEQAYAKDPKGMSELAFTKPPRASVQVAAELEAQRRNLTLLQSLSAPAAPATPTAPAAPIIDPNDPLGILNPPQP